LVAGVERFRRSGAAARFGVYDLGAHLRGVVSRYKNFWIRHSTLGAPRPFDWLNSSLVIVRRRDFALCGGFNERLSMGEGHDLDLGRRLAETCGAVEADPALEVAHLKQFDLVRLVRNDFGRARGWLRCAFAGVGLRGVARRLGWANVDRSFAAGMVFAALASLGLLAGLFFPAALALAALAAAIQVVVNARFVGAAAAARIAGWPLFPVLLALDQLTCAIAVAVETCRWIIASPSPTPEAERLTS
jgi:hypothetical protein